MIKTEFGIIEDIGETQAYSYDPEKYQCVCIDDDIYIDDWWDKLVLLKTYFHNLDRSEIGIEEYAVIEQGTNLSFSLGLDSDGDETVIFNGTKCVRRSMGNLTGRIS